MIRLETERLFLRELPDCGAVSVHDFESRNREFLRPFEPLRQENYFTLEFWEQSLKQQKSNPSDSDLRWYLCPKSDETKVIGRIGFSGIIRGVFHACYLGFVTDLNEQNKGYMTEALTESIRYMFETENLHRIQANHMIRNKASEALLKKLGFVNEGIAKNYLCINGKWEDHVLTSLSNENWKE